MFQLGRLSNNKLCLVKLTASCDPRLNLAACFSRVVVVQKNCTSGQVGWLAEHCFCILGSDAAVAGLLITFCVALFCIGHQHCKLGYLQLPDSGNKKCRKQDNGGWLGVY